MSDCSGSKTSGRPGAWRGPARHSAKIADALHTTQPRVHRMLKAAEARGEAPTPEEIILRATVDGTSRAALVRNLADLNYTFGEHAPEPFEGATSGTWDQVQAARVAGLLSEAEFGRVAAAVMPPS